MPPPAPAVVLPASTGPPPEALAGVACDVPKPDVPFGAVPADEREPNAFDGGEPLLLIKDRRSAGLDVDERPDPGAIWLLAVSIEADDDPPMNISVNTRAI